MANQTDNPKPQKPYAKFPVSVRDRLSEITGGELKVWFAYLAHADRTGTAWPGRDLLARETGMHDDSISTARAGLVRKGWLKRLGNCQMADGRLTGAVRFKVLFPEFPDTGESPAPDKHRYRRKSGTGESLPTDAGLLSATDGGESPALSSSIEVEPNEVLEPEREGAGAPFPSSLTDDELLEEVCLIWEYVADQAFGEAPTHALPTIVATLRATAEGVTDFLERFAEAASLLKYCVFGLTPDTAGWRPSFAWLIEEKNLSKVLAGKYQADLRSLTERDRDLIRRALPARDQQPALDYDPDADIPF